LLSTFRALGRRVRIDFRTDIVNEYFDRPVERGTFDIEIGDEDKFTTANANFVPDDGDGRSGYKSINPLKRKKLLPSFFSGFGEGFGDAPSPAIEIISRSTGFEASDAIFYFMIEISALIDASVP